MFDKGGDSVFDLIQNYKSEEKGSLLDHYSKNNSGSDLVSIHSQSPLDYSSHGGNGLQLSDPFSKPSYLAQNSIEHTLNVRGSNFGHLDALDKMRGVQANRLFLGKDIDIAEAYSDRSLDTRTMGGMYNVTITDIYQDRRRFEQMHGLITDGLVSLQENAQLDLDSAIKKDEFTGTMVGNHEMVHEHVSMPSYLVDQNSPQQTISSFSTSSLTDDFDLVKNHENIHMKEEPSEIHERKIKNLLESYSIMESQTNNDVYQKIDTFENIHTSVSEKNTKFETFNPSDAGIKAEYKSEKINSIFLNNLDKIVNNKDDIQINKDIITSFSTSSLTDNVDLIKEHTTNKNEKEEHKDTHEKHIKSLLDSYSIMEAETDNDVYKKADSLDSLNSGNNLTKIKNEKEEESIIINPHKHIASTETTLDLMKKINEESTQQPSLFIREEKKEISGQIEKIKPDSIVLEEEIEPIIEEVIDLYKIENIIESEKENFTSSQKKGYDYLKDGDKEIQTLVKKPKEKSDFIKKSFLVSADTEEPSRFSNDFSKTPSNRFKENEYYEEQESKTKTTELELKMIPILKTMAREEIREFIIGLEEKILIEKDFDKKLIINLKLKIAKKYLMSL